MREEQGADAVILSNRRIDAGIELIAAVDYDETLMEDNAEARSRASAAGAGAAAAARRGPQPRRGAGARPRRRRPRTCDKASFVAMKPRLRRAGAAAAGGAPAPTRDYHRRARSGHRRRRLGMATCSAKCKDCARCCGSAARQPRLERQAAARAAKAQVLRS